MPLFAGDTPCAATLLPNNMTSFQTYSNLGNSNSGVASPSCGNYINADIWFSVTVPASGILNIATIAGGMTNGAMAIYDGPCSNPNELSCTEDDNCGNTIMPILNLTSLTPGTTIYIRIWAEGGGPNGTFEIRVSDGPIGPIPLPTTSTVGTANYTPEDCVQLTTTATGQSGCAWNPDQIDLSLPFDETFNFNFGNNDAGADGICWVFQNNPAGLSACGGTGQNIAANFGNSFIVEFDTYDNGAAFSDIPNDHASVNVNGDMATAINGPFDLGNIEDGADHEIRFVWTPGSNTYDIYFDGILALSGVYDIINNCLGGSSNCYWGFTGSTGGATNLQSVCPLDVTEYPAGSQMTVDVEICEGESYYAGGANQTTTGVYTDINLLPNGCNEVINTNLTVNPVGYFTYDAALCQGNCELVGTELFCTTGNFEVTLDGQAWNGCDSIVTLNLTILDPVAVAFNPAPLTCFNPTTFIDASPSTSGPGLVTYTWTGPTPGCILSGENTTTPVVNCPGTYTMTLVQLLNGTACSAITTVEVIDAAILPTVEAGEDQSFDCNTNCVTLSSAGSDSGPGYVINWIGPNSFASTDPFPEVCEPGIYSLTVLNQATGCLASDFVTVGGSATPPDIAAVVSGLLTCTDIAVTLDGSGSNGSGALDFEWFDDDNNSIGVTAQVDVSAVGSYTLIITDGINGCTADTMIVVNDNTTEPIAIAIASDSLDCSGSPITIDGSNSSGLGTITYEWFDMDGNAIGVGATNDVSMIGVYTLVISDSENGCTASTTVEVDENIEMPNPIAVVDDLLTCANIETTLDGSTSSGIGMISYEWFDANGVSLSNNPILGVSDTNPYTLVITDGANACTAETTINAVEDIQEPNPEIMADGLLTCIDLEVELDGSNSSGIGMITYEWFDADGMSLGIDPMLDVSDTNPYTLVITDDSNGCTAEATFSPDEDLLAPDPLAQVDDVLTCDQTEVFLDGSGSSGEGTISYEWFDVNGMDLGTDPMLEVSNTDVYTLIITDDSNGCTAETNINADQNIDEPIANAGDNTFITCNDPETTLDGSASASGPDYTYLWMNEGGVDVGTTISIDVSETGTYTLIVTDQTNGCTATSTVEVEPDANLPVADAGTGGAITCSISTINLDGSGSSSGGNISYEWFDPNDLSLGSIIDIDVTDPGTYTLVVTNTDNGCTASSSVEVSEDMEAPTAEVGETIYLTCSETEVMLSGVNSSGGNLSFEWENANGSNIGMDVEVVVDVSETYTLIVTNIDNGCTAEAMVDVLLDMDSPVADAGADGLLTCDIEVYTLDGTNSSGGVLTYEWQNSIGDIIGNEVTFEATESGIYTLIITNENNGCTNTSEVEVMEDVQVPIAVAGEDLTLNCNTTMLTLDGGNSSGGTLTYEWQDENGVFIDNQVTTEITETGTYVLVITNTDNACTASDVLIVDGDYAEPMVDPGIAELLTCAETMITLDGSNSSGTGLLVFEWLDVDLNALSNNATVDIENPGAYTLVITDSANGCTQSAIINVDQNIIAPMADAGQGASLTCDQTEVTLLGSGTSQNGGVSYEWQNSNGLIVGTMASVDVSEIGIYTLTIIDNVNACTAVSTVEVTPDANLPIANAGTSPTLDCAITEVVLDGTNSSIGMNISYEWQDAGGLVLGNLNMLTTENSGTYTLIVTDTDNGCSATSSVEVFEDIEPPLANAGLDATLTCENNQLILNGNMSTTNSGSITGFEWLDENGTLISDFPFADVTEPGIYTLIVTASNACTNTDEIEIFIDASVPEAILGQGGILTCENTSIILGDANSNSGLNVTYQWTDSNGNVIDSNPEIEISTPDIYTLTVINVDNNCETEAELQIVQDILSPLADAGLDATLTCLLTEYELGGLGTSTGLDFSYEWQNANNQVIDDQITTMISNSGDYTLLVTNTMNGCTATSSVSIDEDIEAPVADAGMNGVLTCDITSITLDGSNSTGTSLSYEWQNELGVFLDDTSSIEVSETGMFTLIVSNTENGCTAIATTNVSPDANLPSPIANVDGLLTCANEMVNLDASASTSISGNISFVWENELGSQISDQSIIDINLPGAYTLIVTDTDNGCSASMVLNVDQDIIPPLADADPQQTLVCGQTEVGLEGIGSNGVNLSYQWQDELGNIIANVQNTDVTSAGVYMLIVTNDDNGCSASAIVEVIPDMNLPIVEAGIGETLTCETLSVTLDGSASSQGNNFEYEWQDEIGNVLGTDLILDVDNPGVYTLSILNTDNNCMAQDEVVIDQDIADPSAFADYGAAQSLDCNNTFLTLDGSGSSPFGNLTFFWNTDDGNITSGEETINPEVNAPGTYMLTVTNQTNGCTSSTEIIVLENLTPPNVLINDPSVITCVITEVTLDGTASSSNGDYTYTWTGNGIVSGANTLEAIVDQSGLFTLTIIDNDNGCESEASIEVAENTTPPSANAEAEDGFDCLTENVSLNGNGSSIGAEFSYIWTGSGLIDDAESLNPTVYQAGVYTLIVTDNVNGCTQTDDILVLEDTNVPASVDLMIEAPLCFGDLGNISVLAINGGVAPYLYSLDGGENFGNQNFFANLDPGTYDLVIQDANGCEYSESILIPGQIEVQVVVEPDVLIQLGDDYQINALVNIPESEIDTIIWSPSEGLTCTDCLDPRVDIVQFSVYTVTVINQNGCSATDQITLRVKKDRNVYIPNVFSPNNDGDNEFFMIFSGGNEVKEITDFHVYDRWGEEVFEDHNFQANNPAHGWDGKLNGRNINPGVFVYWARVEFIDGEFLIFKGDVTLIR